MLMANRFLKYLRNNFINISKRQLVFLFWLTVFIAFIPNILYAHDNIEVHPYITEQAFYVWPDDKSHEIYFYLGEDYRLPSCEWWNIACQDYMCELAKSGKLITEGTKEEDDYDPVTYLCNNDYFIGYFHHFYQPDWSEPNGLFTDIYNTGALAYARLYWNEIKKIYPVNKEMAYWYLGRIAHLLADVSVPAHVHNDPHDPVSGSDSYENYIKKDEYGTKYWKQWKTYDAKKLDSIPETSIPETWKLEDLFWNLAQRTQYFPSDNYDGNTTNADLSWFSGWPDTKNWRKWSIVDDYIENSNLLKIGDKLMPLAIQYTAALYKLFWNETHPVITPDIKANSSDGPLNITTNDTLSITVSLGPGSLEGTNADWWVVADTPFGLYYYVYPSQWNMISGLDYILWAYKGPLFNLPSTELINVMDLPAGTYTIYFGVDTVMNGQLDFDYLYYDSVVVNVTASNITPPAAPDLVVSGSVSVSPNPVTVGSNVTISYTVLNQGTANAGASTTKIQIKNTSTNILLTEGYFSTSAISAGSSTINESHSLQIPSNAATGNYTVYIILDTQNSIGQSDTSNDYASAGLSIGSTGGGALQVTPIDRFDSSGPQGGPFNPLSKTYTLSNTGVSSINWTASKGQNWVNLSSTSGTISPGGSTQVVVSINSSANSLTSGNYVDTVTFTNTTDGNGNATRTVNLTVTYSTPTITVGPTSLNFGNVQVGTCSTAVFVIQHVLGTGTASGNVSASPNPPFSILSGSSFSVSNGSAANVTVQFCPTSSGTFNGTATVSSTATFIGTNTIALTGTGYNSCTYSISPASQSFGSSGGYGSVSVTTSSGCSWTASSSYSWITITSGSSGGVSGTVNYSVASNSSTSSRTGTITIAGQTFTLTQSGAPASSCSEVEPNDSSSQANPLTLNVGCTGKISSSTDKDWFDVYVSSGTTISFTLTVPAGLDYDMALYGPDSSNSSQHWLKESTNPAGQNETITYTTTATGYFAVQIYGYQGAYSTTSAYTITRSQ